MKILFGENADNNCRTESKGLDIKVEDMFNQVHTKHERWSVCGSLLRCVDLKFVCVFCACSAKRSVGTGRCRS